MMSCVESKVATGPLAHLPSEGAGFVSFLKYFPFPLLLNDGKKRDFRRSTRIVEGVHFWLC